jgi:CubicO group peptidase (beta-lactamase class C family)
MAGEQIVKIAALAIAAATLAGCAVAPSKPERVARGDFESVKRYVGELTRYEMRKHDVVGLSIAVVDDQKIAWAGGFGYADKAAGVAATPDTVYRVGSISKLFTATAAMRLAEQGKLDIDKPLQTYLPEFSIKSRFPGTVPITPRMLMTHHAGLPGDVFQGMWAGNPEPFTGLVSRIRDEYVAYPPNYVFSYSNLGFSVLGHAVEKLTGADFAAHLDQTLLQPLGMTGSSFSTRLDSPRMAKAYHKGGEATESALRDVPAGGLDSSVNDLSRFLMMVFAEGRSSEQRILRAETLREMLRPQNDAVPLDQGFHIGLAWILSGLGDINIEGAGAVAHHAGGTLYYHSQLIALPQHKLGVVVLSNSSSAHPAVNRIATETLKLALEAKTGIQQPRRNPPHASTDALSKEALDTYAGHYATAVGYARINARASSLRAEIFDQSFDLFPRTDGYLGVRYRLFGIFPIEVEQLAQYGLSRTRVSGRELLLAHSGGQKLVIGEKIAPVPIPGAWLKRTGEYEIVNGADDAIKVEKIRLSHRDGFLILDFSLVVPAEGAATLVLTPVSGNEAIIAGIGRGAGETLRAVTIAGEEHFAYSGYLVRKKTTE